MTSAYRLSGYRALVLHIGVYKTGSSHLQALFLANRAALASRSIHFPPYRDPGMAQRRGGNHSMAVLRMGTNGLWPGLSETLDLASPHATLLLSAEDFARPDRLAHVLDRLPVEAPGLDSRFIAYLRRYDHLLESAYAQAVKHREHGPLEPDAQGVRFHQDLPRIRDRLGHRALILRPYTARHWPGGQIGQDFTTALGWTGLWAQMTEGREARQNVGLSRVHTHLLSRLTAVADKQALLAYFSDHPPPGAETQTSRFFLSPATRRQLNRDCLKQDAAMFRDLGIDDPVDFLDLESFPDADSWTPFRPDTPALDRYLQQFFDRHQAPTAAARPAAEGTDVENVKLLAAKSPGAWQKIFNKFKLGRKKT